MDFLFDEAFSEGFFIVGTLLVVGITWFGYAQNRYLSSLSTVVVAVFVTYLVAFFLYRYLSGHVEEHMEREPSYLLIAIGHGIVSLTAILLACYVFVLARRSFERGDNYFKVHPKTSLLLVALWPLALLSGFLLG